MNTALQLLLMGAATVAPILPLDLADPLWYLQCVFVSLLYLHRSFRQLNSLPDGPLPLRQYQAACPTSSPRTQSVYCRKGPSHDEDCQHIPAVVVPGETWIGSYGSLYLPLHPGYALDKFRHNATARASIEHLPTGAYNLRLRAIEESGHR